MSQDLNMLFPCNHVGGQFLVNNCPVCLGQGLYLDLVLDQKGQPELVDGVNKVVQEIVHLFYHDEGVFKDYGYPEYGSRINKFIGSKNLTPLRLKFQVLRDLQYISNIKEKQHNRYRNIDRKEIIKQIVAIKTSEEADTQSVELSAIIGDEDQLQFFSVRRFKF